MSDRFQTGICRFALPLVSKCAVSLDLGFGKWTLSGVKSVARARHFGSGKIYVEDGADAFGMIVKIVGILVFVGLLAVCYRLVMKKSGEGLLAASSSKTMARMQLSFSGA